MIKIIGIIPARYASTRFPGKPLVDIQGKSMIQRVYEQCNKSNLLTKTYVATDDNRIFEHLKEIGANVIMTSQGHQTGTDRCNEAIQNIEKKEGTSFDVVVNIQGDEPFIHPEQIDTLCGAFSDVNTDIATLARPISAYENVEDPNMVKLIRDKNNKAIYFSRFPIPFYRDNAKHEHTKSFLKHIGIYAYRKDILKEISQLAMSSLEKAESLEQLRWLENGYHIKVELTEHESISIDTKEDLERIV